MAYRDQNYQAGETKGRAEVTMHSTYVLFIGRVDLKRVLISSN